MPYLLQCSALVAIKLSKTQFDMTPKSDCDFRSEKRQIIWGKFVDCVPDFGILGNTPRVTTHMNLQIMMTWHHVPNIKKGFPSVLCTSLDPMTPTNSQKQDTIAPKGPIDDTALERTDRHDHLVQHHYVRQHLIPDKDCKPQPHNKSIHPHLEGQDFQQKNKHKKSHPHGLPQLEFDWLIDPPPRLGVKITQFFGHL